MWLGACLAPSGVTPKTEVVGCSAPVGACAQRPGEPHCHGSYAHSLLPLQVQCPKLLAALPHASALLPLQNCLCSSSSSSYLFLTKFFPFEATGVRQSAQPCVRCRKAAGSQAGAVLVMPSPAYSCPYPFTPNPGLPSWSVHPPPVGSHASDLLEAKPRALNEAMTLNQEACIIDRKPKKAQGEEQGRTEIGSRNGASLHPGVKVTFQDLVLKAGGLQRGCGL